MKTIVTLISLFLLISCEPTINSKEPNSTKPEPNLTKEYLKFDTLDSDKTWVFYLNSGDLAFLEYYHDDMTLESFVKIITHKDVYEFRADVVHDNPQSFWHGSIRYGNHEYGMSLHTGPNSNKRFQFMLNRSNCPADTIGHFTVPPESIGDEQFKGRDLYCLLLQ